VTKSRSFAPIIAAVLLLLPMLYVGGYLALVVPEGGVLKGGESRVTHYRAGDRAASVVFWPLEQIDRKARRRDWDDSY
jgi:hypothetical protein